MPVALCLLPWDEIGGVRPDVPLLDRSRFDQVFCIDGGSDDGTIPFLESNGVPVFRQTAKGLNQACYDAFDRCTCDALVLFHPKGTVPVGDAYRFRPLFERGFGLVVASRMAKGARNEEDGRLLKPRKWFVLLLALAARLALCREGEAVRDVLHGFRGMTREAFARMPRTDGGCTIDLEMVCHAYRERISRTEFPTRESPRLGGATHFRAWRTGRRLLRSLWTEIRRRPAP